MPARYEDWFRQAKRDLAQARHAMDGEFHEVACFSSQQAAEKAVKALYQSLGGDAWGHSVTSLLKELPESVTPAEELIERALVLDRHYVPPRYPNGVPEGIGADYYTRKDAEEALGHAEAILTFCESHLLS